MCPEIPVCTQHPESNIRAATTTPMSSAFPKQQKETRAVTLTGGVFVKCSESLAQRKNLRYQPAESLHAAYLCPNCKHMFQGFFFKYKNIDHCSPGGISQIKVNSISEVAPCGSAVNSWVLHVQVERLADRRRNSE